ncbi:MAG: hypothetical protein P8100_12125 [bacterium]|jgi:uncharacterized protein YqgV (UPF0045/DUF77 family)
MNTSVEISYYPLEVEFIPHIKDFIQRLNTYGNIRVRTNGMSTQVFGAYFDVMEILTKEIHQSFKLPHSIFVMKIINADLDINDGGDH